MNSSYAQKNQSELMKMNMLTGEVTPTGNAELYTNFKNEWDLNYDIRNNKNGYQILGQLKNGDFIVSHHATMYFYNSSNPEGKPFCGIDIKQSYVKQMVETDNGIYFLVYSPAKTSIYDPATYSVYYVPYSQTKRDMTEDELSIFVNWVYDDIYKLFEFKSLDGACINERGFYGIGQGAIAKINFDGTEEFGYTFADIKPHFYYKSFHHDISDIIYVNSREEFIFFDKVDGGWKIISIK